MEDVKEAQTKPEETALVKTEPKPVRAKDAQGRFISKKNKLSSERYTIKRREFLEQKDPKNPRKTRAEVIDEELYELVQLGTTDPKYSTAAVNASKQLAERAHGRTPPSDRELDRLTTFPISTVFIPYPNMMHPEIIEEKPREVRRPSWEKEVKDNGQVLEGEYQK
jgi:hypothetical protein